jgi:small subunit ribosomal protein S20
LAHTLSARKRWRASLRRRERNRVFVSAAKTHVSSATRAIETGDGAEAETAVRRAASALDRASQKGIIHPRNAARRKSRLMLRYNRALAAAPEGPVKPARRRRPAEPKAETAKKAPAKATTAKKTTAKKTTAKKSAKK